VHRTAFGRALAAVREKDYAAEVIGVDTFRFKLLAFWTSSFIVASPAPCWSFAICAASRPTSSTSIFSVQIVAMVIVGGLWQRCSQLLRCGADLFTPIVLNNLVGALEPRPACRSGGDLRAHIPLMLYGALIVGFLVLEPLGLASLRQCPQYFLVLGRSHARR